jgi:ABC-type antimicrobial peptide transport system permease subunit
LNRQVSAGYFSTLQAQLIRGRYFPDRENDTQPRVAIVNRSVANRYFAGEDPIGKQIYYDWAPNSLMEIVGVVEDIKEGPLENPNLPVLYVPFDQNPKPWFAVLIRTAPNGQSALASIPDVIHRIDRDIAVSSGGAMLNSIQNSSIAYLHRSSAWLAGGFAAVAFVLGVIGLYGVVAYSVGHRTREIGVRMALGADPASVYRLVLGEAARLVGAGAALGIGGSLAAETLIRGSFYEVHPWDVPTLATVASMLIAAALMASVIPARHAASTNPIEALRSE